MLLSSMDKNWQSDQVHFARLLGLNKRAQVFFAFKISAGPTIVMAGVVAGYLLGGAVLIESIFNLNGIGQYAVQSIISADYAPIQAFVLIAVVYVMLVYLVVDVVFAIVDPRVRKVR
jgi:peptide/nickel transport system permease protein